VFFGRVMGFSGASRSAKVTSLPYVRSGSFIE